ncbi:MAG: YkgJ family cysteine cluster protein [Rhodomicrobiaceae bacterium]
MSSFTVGGPPAADHADASLISNSFDCQTCGACCSYSSDWPRFTLESDADIDRIPERFVNGAQSGMRCEGGRCSALSGKVGEATSCRIYEIRPDVCRECEPGDEACRIARHAFQLSDLAAV